MKIQLLLFLTTLFWLISENAYCNITYKIPNSLSNEAISNIEIKDITLFFNESLAKNYINLYKDIAIQEMYRSEIPASIKLAQGMFESGYGKSKLARDSNNHFGLKCKSEWKGDKVYFTDDAPNECFRKYSSVYDSYIDQSDYLHSKVWYAPLFEISLYDYRKWAKKLEEIGYATNKQYSENLIAIIEKYRLYELDNLLPNNIGPALPPVVCIDEWRKLPSTTPNKPIMQDCLDETKLYVSTNSSTTFDENDWEVIGNELRKIEKPALVRINKELTPNNTKPKNISTNGYIPVLVHPNPNFTPTPPPDFTPNRKPNNELYTKLAFNHYSLNPIPNVSNKAILTKIELPKTNNANLRIIKNLNTNSNANNVVQVTESLKTIRLRKKGYLVNNKVKYIEYNSEVNIKQIAKLYNIMLAKLLLYNDLARNLTVPAHTKIYVDFKNTKPPRGKRYHIVKNGETIWHISQQYGLKQNILYKINNIPIGKQPIAGEKILLKGKAKKTPKLMAEYNNDLPQNIVFTTQTEAENEITVIDIN